jgi:hypothetical protein
MRHLNVHSYDAPPRPQIDARKQSGHGVGVLFQEGARRGLIRAIENEHRADRLVARWVEKGPPKLYAIGMMLQKGEVRRAGREPQFDMIGFVQANSGEEQNGLEAGGTDGSFFQSPPAWSTRLLRAIAARTCQRGVDFVRRRACPRGSVRLRRRPTFAAAPQCSSHELMFVT